MTGDELKEWRERRGLTQKDLSDILSATEGEIPQPRISEWERGVHKVPRWMRLELNGVTFGDDRDGLPKIKTG